MAIENLDLSNQQDQNNNVPVVINAGTALEANQILIANMQKIRHPLMDCEMVLYGFIGEVSSDVIFDENEVDGLTIRFKKRNSDGLQSFTIFPKILVDLKKHRFYDLFPQLESIKYSYLGHSGGKKFWREDDPDNKKNYYFFKKFFDTIPEVFSDEVYFVCKYREDGKFKYEIFSPHEVKVEG
jgi:hypothetical protein